MEAESNVLKHVLGTSTGEANQSFSCGLFPQSVWVHEDHTSDGWVEWRLVEEWSQSREENRHYILNQETGVIHFGDGRQGKIPPAGSTITAIYHSGTEAEGSRDASLLKAESEYVRMYYDHQYDRMAKLEDQRLIITNIVIGLSTVAFTFGIPKTENLSFFSGVCLPIVMILSNVLAMAYLVHSADVIDAHQKRAKKVLERYAQDLFKIDKDTQWLQRIGERWKIQVLIHLALCIIALTPLYLYFSI